MKTIDLNLLQPSDILICVGNSVLAKTILKATGGQWSHTAQVIELNGIKYIFDAQEGGCMPRTFDRWKREFDYEFKVFRRTPTKDLSDWYMQFSGTRYDKKGLAVGLGKSLIKNVFSTKQQMKDKYRNNGLFWCSELTMKPYVDNPEQFTPQDVYEWVTRNKNLWVEIK
jgi:hypothetical protein